MWDKLTEKIDEVVHEKVTEMLRKKFRPLRQELWNKLNENNKRVKNQVMEKTKKLFKEAEAAAQPAVKAEQPVATAPQPTHVPQPTTTTPQPTVTPQMRSKKHVEFYIDATDTAKFQIPTTFSTATPEPTVTPQQVVMVTPRRAIHSYPPRSNSRVRPRVRRRMWPGTPRRLPLGHTHNTVDRSFSVTPEDYDYYYSDDDENQPQNEIMSRRHQRKQY